MAKNRWDDSKFLKAVGVTADRDVIDAERECAFLREESDRVLEQNKRLIRKMAEMESGGSRTADMWRGYFLGMATATMILAALRILGVIR